MNKTLGKIFFWLLIGALLFYSASRTVDLIGMTLSEDSQIIKYLALAAFDGGLLVWSYLFLKHAEGQLQRAIALIMTLVSLLAVIVGFVGDTVIQASMNGLITQADPALARMIIYVTCGVIAAHIAAGVLYHIADPSNLRAISEETAKDKIAAAAMRQIDQHADSLAEELAPQVAAAWVAQMRGRVQSALSAGDVFLVDKPEVIDGRSKPVETFDKDAGDPGHPKS